MGNFKETPDAYELARHNLTAGRSKPTVTVIHKDPGIYDPEFMRECVKDYCDTIAYHEAEPSDTKLTIDQTSSFATRNLIDRGDIFLKYLIRECYGEMSRASMFGTDEIRSIKTIIVDTCRWWDTNPAIHNIPVVSPSEQMGSIHHLTQTKFKRHDHCRGCGVELVKGEYRHIQNTKYCQSCFDRRVAGGQKIDEPIF